MFLLYLLLWFWDFNITNLQDFIKIYRALIKDIFLGLDARTRPTLWRHVQSGRVGFPLLLKKALAGVKKHGFDVCRRRTLSGPVQSRRVGFSLLLNKRLPGVKNHAIDVSPRCTL